MKRTNVLISVLIALAVTLSVAFVATGGRPAHQWFKDQTKERLAALEAQAAAQEARIVVLEAMVVDLDAGMVGLVEDGGTLWQLDRNILWVQEIVNREHSPIALTGINPETICDDTECHVTVEWFSDPPATGQVEWGLTDEYGNLNGIETRLLDYHKQTVGTFPFDTTIHFRILAEIPEEDLSVTSASSIVSV